MEKIRVLMVDDEEKFRETTAKILNRRGYETTVAGSGEEALTVLRERAHDVVVLDIKMPGMDGHEALTEIKKIRPETQVIMLTGHGGLESARHSLEYEAFDYLTKPCDIDHLAGRIKDAYSSQHREFRGKEKKAGDVMIPIEAYTTVGPQATVAKGIRLLQTSFLNPVSTSRLMETGHRSIMVLDEAGTLIGGLTIMDLIEALRPGYLSAPKPSMADSMQYSAMFWSGLFTKQAHDLGKKPIGDIMSPPPPSIDEEANLMETANRLYEEECRRLAVMRGGKVIGVVREQEIFFEMARLILEN